MLHRQMQYFVSVVECGSFTEAAEQNYISQSAISQQIHALEQELGVRLIVRENRKFYLTTAGEYFYRRTRELLQNIEAVKKETMRLGGNEELQLKIGYLNYYGGQELQQAIADFSAIYPEVSISIMNGTHEELRKYVRSGEADIILMEQRRTFSDTFVNLELLKCDCYIEISIRHPLSQQDRVTVEDLSHTSCILISSREQQYTEQDFYESTLGFGGNFIFAESLEEGRLMTVGNRGFMPIEIVGTLPPPSPTVKRLPLYLADHIIQRNYCAFWPKEKSNYYIEQFADILKKLLHKTQETVLE